MARSVLASAATLAALLLGLGCGGSGTSPAGTDATGTGGAGGPGGAGQGGAGTGASATGGAGGAGTGGARPGGPRYDEVQQKATHNSYDRDEALLDQLIYHRVRALEIDIHVGKWMWPDVAGDWYVYHENGPGLNGTSCHRLSDCLKELAAFHAGNPEHEVTTVFVDLKDAFQSAGHEPDDLDARLLAGIDESVIFGPKDLLAHCEGAATLVDSVTSCGWPALDELRGRMIFALTGGDLCQSASVLGDYVNGAAAGDRVAFVAPGLSDGCTHVDNQARSPNAVFFNADYPNVAHATEVHDAGFVSRVYYGGIGGGLDDEASWDGARDAEAHFLATNMVNFEVTPWAVTHNTHGWPFSCFAGCDPDLVEAGQWLGMRVSSGDIWGSSDNFNFLYEEGQTDAATWTAQISTANSHVEAWAKGCLMARATADADSPYLAVCRPADAHVIRVQARGSKGGSSDAYETTLQPSDTIDPESVTFVQLEIAGTTAAPTVNGYASQNGVDWVLIHGETFSVPLPLRGISASGHGSANPVKFLFGDLTRTTGAATRYRVADLPRHARFGDCSLGDAFDGVFP